jgi:hypothetical protein
MLLCTSISRLNYVCNVLDNVVFLIIFMFNS